MNNKKKRSKRFIIGMTSAVAAAVLVVGVTISYMIASTGKDNVFSLGDVKLTLTEDNFPSSIEDRIMAPKGIVEKDPCVINTGSSEQYVFLKVTVPLAEVQIVNENDNKINESGKAYREIFNIISSDSAALSVASGDSFTVTDRGSFSYNSKWRFLKSYEDLTNNTHTYVFGYSELLPWGSDNVTESLFDKIQLRNILEYEITETDIESVRVNAYGIQAKELLNNVRISDTSNATAQELTAVYALFEKQEGE